MARTQSEIEQAVVECIDHEHKHERGAISVSVAVLRDAAEWTCAVCGASGEVDGEALLAHWRS